jgi:hypothetical protein
MVEFGKRQSALAAKVAELRQQFPSGEVRIVSLADPTGGKPGVITEVTIEAAAREIIEGRAHSSDTNAGEN